jgi:hypothetical protein
MKRMLSLALMCALSFSQFAGLAAQVQPPRSVTGNVLQADGVISGTVSSSSGRSLSGITMELVDARGTVVGKTVSARNGDFSFQPVSYDTYTLQCVDDNKVIGTSSVTLKAATESVKITCTSDVPVVWWKNTGVLTGLAAAAAAIGAAAIVATTGDASGSR